MNSKKMLLLNSIVFIIIGSMLVYGAETANAKVDYLNLVRSYADAMIEYGRDVYGPDKTPLFAVALDRKNMKLIEKLEKTQGIRPVDRHLKCGNPMVDQNLYQILYALTEVTGEAVAPRGLNCRFFTSIFISKGPSPMMWFMP
jgi:hypothetical protein